MSIVPNETIEVIAQSIGISNLSPDVLPALAADVEYRIREIMQEAIKSMRHSRRTTLTTEDVDSALAIRNVEPIYGFASGDPLRFARAAGHKDLFYIEEKDVEFKEVIEAPLPKAPLDTSVVAHWLAIEGVQPVIPENPPPEALQSFSMPSDTRKTEFKDDGVPVDIKLPIKHVLSRELKLYFDKISELTLNRSDSPVFKQALLSLATDSGIHPLVPYFTFFVADEVSNNLNNFTRLFALMRVVWSLLRNPHIHVEPYLHQLMPSIMTCLVAKRLGNRFSDNHWNLRKFTANLLASICKRFGHVYHDLQPRVSRTLLHAFLDPSKALTQHYGAIQGLAALGPNVIRLLLLPNLEAYMRLLEPEMQLEKQNNEAKRHEAWLVYGALMCAAGLSLYDRLKIIPSLTSTPAHSILKNNHKVLTTGSNKRKPSFDNTDHQPPEKKLATDSSTGLIMPTALPGDMPGTSSGYSANMDASMQRSRSVMDNVVGTSSGNLKSTASVGRMWKKDASADARDFLPRLYEYFGECMLSFVPCPEASLFL
ncbi:transcription initiation factor TFIID subunit 6-like [Andrographis paniculata]|uniref:transcription initiation factor TFIID subunit 6-like n=1 Tax=Andrographis paniculata TaxID=175694 RepID=UPI0021E7A5A6|nr:transcription initiation factor TFIID subunit 6-like [Andrographis paniculata]